MEELKLCPFCGGNAEMWRNYGKFGPFVYVKCAICDAQTRIKTAKDIDDDDSFWNQSACHAVAALWNQRGEKE